MRTLVVHHNGNQSPDRCGDVVDGELARMPDQVCGNPQCKCTQVCIGLASGEPSTTMRVADINASHADLFVEYVSAAQRDNTIGTPNQLPSLLIVAEELTPGTVLRPAYDTARQAWGFRVIA